MAIRACILAGGYGTRLGQLTKNLPKPLIKSTAEITLPVSPYLSINLGIF